MGYPSDNFRTSLYGLQEGSYDWKIVHVGLDALSYYVKREFSRGIAMQE